MKFLRSFETSGTTRPKTQRHIPGDLNIKTSSAVPYSLQ